MRFQEPISAILNNEVKINCLRFLYKYPAELTGRQLAKMVKGSPATVHRAMKELSDEHVVVSKNIGNAHIYELNKTNLIVAKIIIPMFNEEEKLLKNFLKRLADKINKSTLNDAIISVVLFGSIHEGKETPTSDIDIFILVKKSSDKVKAESLIFDFGKELQSEINMSIEPYVKTKAEFYAQKESNIIKSIMKSHRFVWGEKLEALS